jgi:DNA-binding NarL/FixJ family response regulator
LLIVDAASTDVDAWQDHLSQAQGIEITGVTGTRRAAIAGAETTRPDVLLVDLMLPGRRGIDIIRHVADTQPPVHILALAPSDPPHDQIMLAIRAGALGYVCRDAEPSELEAAIARVHHGQPWLPLHQTYEVLQDGAGELAVTAEERRNRLAQVVLGFIPLTGLIAAITAYLWRQYYGAIGVRVVDLGIDPTTRMTDVLVVFVLMIGILGPLLFVASWVAAIGEWVEKKPRLTEVAGKAQGLRLSRVPVGRIVFNRWVAQIVLALLVLSTALLVNELMPLVMVLFVGPAVGIILMASALGMEDEFPEILHLPHLAPERVLGFLGLVVIVFVLALGAEVLLIGPDLRVDGLHGVLAPEVLGIKANPVMLFDLEEKEEPLGALYLGGNADLYVLYDPCEAVVRFVPVGSSRVEFIDRVTCPSP